LNVFRVAALVFAVFSPTAFVSAAQSACPSGYVPASAPPGRSSGCMLAGSVDCGRGKSCPAGFICSRLGGCVESTDVSCGNYYCPTGSTCAGGGVCRGGGPWTGPLCGNPTGTGIRLKCHAGWQCGPDDRCYDPKITFFCGKAKCLFAGQYNQTSECGRCVSPERLCYRYPYRYHGLAPPPMPPWLNIRANPYAEAAPRVWYWSNADISWSWEVRPGFNPRNVDRGRCVHESNPGGPH
jgi:hypothetical protein